MSLPLGLLVESIIATQPSRSEKRVTAFPRDASAPTPRNRTIVFRFRAVASTTRMSTPRSAATFTL